EAECNLRIGLKMHLGLIFTWCSRDTDDMTRTIQSAIMGKTIGGISLAISPLSLHGLCWMVNHLMKVFLKDYTIRFNLYGKRKICEGMRIGLFFQGRQVLHMGT